MIKITVDLISARGPEHNKTLGVMLITNDGVKSAQNPARGDYLVYLARKGVFGLKDLLKRPQRRGEVKDFARASYSVWVLVARALKAVGIEKWADFKEEPELTTEIQLNLPPIRWSKEGELLESWKTPMKPLGITHCTFEAGSDYPLNCVHCGQEKDAPIHSTAGIKPPTEYPEPT